jgi:hypothetical protein
VRDFHLTFSLHLPDMALSSALRKRALALKPPFLNRTKQSLLPPPVTPNAFPPLHPTFQHQPHLPTLYSFPNPYTSHNLLSIPLTFSFNPKAVSSQPGVRQARNAPWWLYQGWHGCGLWARLQTQDAGMRRFGSRCNSSLDETSRYGSLEP